MERKRMASIRRAVIEAELQQMVAEIISRAIGEAFSPDNFKKIAEEAIKTSIDKIRGRVY